MNHSYYLSPLPKKPNYLKQVVFTISAALFVAAIVFSVNQAVKAMRVNCGSFNSRGSAQTAFNSNPRLYARLDANRDGVVCQDFKYRHD